MNYFLLCLAVLFLTGSYIFKKQYNVKFAELNNSVFFFNFIMTASSFLFFAVYFLFNLEINLPSIPYSVAFALTIDMSFVFGILAIRIGPLSLTCLVESFALLIPTFYGVIFCGEEMSVFGIFGVIALVISLIFVNEYKKENDEESNKKITPKYLLFLALSFLGNGFCSTFQKMHQIKFGGNYGSFLMVVAMFIASIINLVVFLVVKKPKFNENKKLYTFGTMFGAGAGLFNGIHNLLVMTLTVILPSIILYPVVSAGNAIILFILSLTVYKEKFKPYQYFGYFMGFVAIVLLNI